MTRRTIAEIGIGFLVIGWVIGWFANNYFYPPPAPPVPIRQDTGDYKFVNPLLFFRTTKNFYIEEFTSLVRSLDMKIDRYVVAKKAKNVSVYFADLNSGHWTGIGENEIYAPSSMLKVVVMVATLRLAEQNPELLLKKLHYDNPDQSDQYYKPAETLTTGLHTINELISAMIINSDNGALDALLTNKDIQAELQNVNAAFRLPLLVSATTTDFMSPRSYSAVFRVLYNGAYISPDLDDQILALLSNTTFKNGIVAGVMPGTMVAHKFGEHSSLANSKVVAERQLHDCGVVYYPGRPYLLCIMTKGSNFQDLEEVIADVSRIVYEYVRTQATQ